MNILFKRSGLIKECKSLWKTQKYSIPSGTPFFNFCTVGKTENLTIGVPKEVKINLTSLGLPQ